MRRRKRTAAALALGAWVLWVGPGRAEEPCAADARKICTGIPPGDGRIFYCLKSNRGSLSEGCRELIRWAEDRAYEVALDCQADTFAWCQGVPAGQGRLFACLISHRDSISSQCQDALTRVSAFNAGCGADVARLCPGLSAGKGAILVCLVTQRNLLSPSCQAVLWP
jgi:Golgi apparatus protein 1